MNRRTVLGGASVMAAAAALGIGGFVATGPAAPWTLRHARRVLLELDVHTAVLAGSWSTAQVLVHLAQSLEFSMTGFPEAKGALFQATVGRTAATAFGARGQMFHGLDTPIPGAPALPTDLSPSDARSRLIAAIDAFDGFDGELRPHFTYGPLDRAAYARAQALHIENHLRATVG
ncbi:MAG: DUF1569 domain-containing protein [Myxococcales bacterium]|nr:DUF1569 domain-containing protein [Myxococcales bacterium]